MPRFVSWCTLVALLLAGQAVWIILLRGERVMSHPATLIIGQMLLTLGLLAMMALLVTTPAEGAIRLSARASRAWILGGAAALQVMAVLLLWPAMSEDLVRYRLDGRLWHSGASPYATSPAEAFAGGRFVADAIDRTVTYPAMHTIYPPVSQAIFTVAAGIDRWIAPPQPETAGATWRSSLAFLPPAARGIAFRLLFAACAVASSAVLINVLVRAGQSPWWAALFAWHPLVVFETGGMGHQDIVGVLLLLLMLSFAQQSRYRAAAVVLALACGVKPLAAVVLPFLYRDAHLHNEFRAGRKTVAVFVIGIALIYLPAALYQRGYEGWMETARTYSSHWEANGSIYEWMKGTFGQAGERGATAHDGWPMQHAKEQSRVLAMCAVLAAMLLLWQFRASLAAAGYTLFLVMLLFSPVVYPWYLLWLLALVPLLRGENGWGAMVWCGTVAISYLLWETPNWTLPRAALWAEYVPVYALVIAELAWALKRNAAGDAVERPVLARGG